MNAKDNTHKTTNKLDYLNLVEDFNNLQEEPLNLFEKILVIRARAKDIQQIQNTDSVFDSKPGYQALNEYKLKQLKPIITEKTEPTEQSEDEEDINSEDI